MILTNDERADIEKWRSTVTEEILLQLFINKDDAGRQILAFCTEMADLVPEIILETAGESDDVLSKIMIGHNISYSALPHKNELEPFLGALSARGFLGAHIPDLLEPVITNISIPVMLKIYVSPDCPFCPGVVSQSLAAARLNPVINVSVIDGSLYPEQAARDNIRSVPALILDDSFRWTGEVDPEELIRMITERDPLNLGADTLRNIIHDGRAEEVAEMMVNRGKVFPAFVELLIDINWTVRLGAMAVFEYLVEKSPELCHEVNVELGERFPDQDSRVQGDIIYLMGESSDPAVRPFLEKVIKGDFTPEVIESAMDALDNFHHTAT